VVNAQWKYLLYPDGFDELYDRQTDPHELHNRINDGALSPIREAMHAKLG
ncbi:MAG: hypothetical protein HN849_14530, partial [Victivallales bacterium]|nr:hypothetical protein [Victivallales bacterium]